MLHFVRMVINSADDEPPNLRIMKTLTKKATILKRILSLEPIVSVLREAVEGTSVGAEDGITFGKALGTAKVTPESEVK